MTYQEILDKTIEAVRDIYTPEELANAEAEKTSIEKALSEPQTIKVPVIGVFTAGKTTLFNTLLGEKDGKLPVNMTPTTSIPCEIYPTDSETYVSVIHDGEEIYHGNVDGYGAVETRPGDVAKLYVNHPDILRWYEQGITLVDMPGSDSGLREHNEAIMRYISKGNQFIFFVSAATGALGTTDIALLREIKHYGLREVIITKADLASPDALEATREYITYQLRDIFGDEPTKIATVCSARGDISAFKKCIDDINAQEVIADKVSPLIKGYVDAQRFSLNTRLQLSAGASSIEEIDAKISDINNNIAELERVIHDSVNRADTPEKSTNDVLDAIRQAIAANSDLVTDAIINSNKGETTQTVAEVLVSVIRPAMINALRIEQEEYITTLNTEINKIAATIIDSITIDDDVIGQTIQENETLIVGGLRVFADKLINNPQIYVQVLGHVLNFVAEYVPDLLRGLFSNQEKLTKKVSEQVRGPIASKIAQGLRPSMLDVVKARQRQILESAMKQYEARIEQMHEAIKALESQKETGLESIAAEAEKINTAIETLNTLYAEI